MNAPPLPPTVDLRGFNFMPLDVVRLRDSEFTMKATGDEFRCAVLLWCASWHQVPSASLPDDDILLAGLAGFGRVVKEWKRVREGALRGFVKCADGRLYHAVIAEKALEAWRAQLTRMWKTECARQKKQAQRKKEEPNLPDFDMWITLECPEAIPYLSRRTPANENRDSHVNEWGRPPNVPMEIASVPMEIHSKGSEGKGRELKPIPSDQHSPGVNHTAAAFDAIALADSKIDPETPAAILASVCLANGIQTTPFHPLVVDWARDGVTVEGLKSAIATARIRKPAPQKIPIAYLAAILDDAGKPQIDSRWRTDDGECERLARELGMWPARANESWKALRDRIHQALHGKAREAVQ